MYILLLSLLYMFFLVSIKLCNVFIFNLKIEIFVILFKLGSYSNKKNITII